MAGLLRFLFLICTLRHPWVQAQLCECRTSDTFHLPPILLLEEEEQSTPLDVTAAASLAQESSTTTTPQQRNIPIQYRYCELPRTETTERLCQFDDRSQGWVLRQHFDPAPVCSEWKTKWLSTSAVLQPFFHGASVSTNKIVYEDVNNNVLDPCFATHSEATTSWGCSRPRRGSAEVVFATMEDNGGTVCFSYREQVVDVEYCASSVARVHTTSVKCHSTNTMGDLTSTVHRIPLERTSSGIIVTNSTSATKDQVITTLYVEYTTNGNTAGPSELQSIFPSSPTCAMLDVKQACASSDVEHVTGVYERKLDDTYNCPHQLPEARGSVYVHTGILENTVLYYNSKLEGWVFLPEQHYCDAEHLQYVTAVFAPGAATATCFTADREFFAAPLDVQCLPGTISTNPVDALCRGMKDSGGIVFTQECVGATAFRQMYHLCRLDRVVGVESRSYSCQGLLGEATEAYCYDSCSTTGGFVVCAATTDPAAACELTKSTECNTAGWVTAVGCSDDSSFVSFGKQCVDGETTEVTVSEPLPCETNDAHFTTCHDDCHGFSICSSDSFQCPQRTESPTFEPTAFPTMFPSPSPESMGSAGPSGSPSIMLEPTSLPTILADVVGNTDDYQSSTAEGTYPSHSHFALVLTFLLTFWLKSST